MKKIILDTDLGGDCDDAGALAVLCNLAKRGEAEILAVTYCIGNPWGAWFTRSELDFFGFKNVPLGTLKDEGFMDEPHYAKYSRPYCETYGVAQIETEDAVRVLRRTLAENGGKADIELVAVGPLRNIANLLRSEADDISPLSGRELIKANVAHFVTMLASFDRPDYVEWNVLMDKPSAQYCIAEMPVPVLFSPHELGSHIFTGNNNEALPENHPVRFAYYVYSGKTSFLRQSWDPITVYAAVRGCEELFRLRETRAALTDDGRAYETAGADKGGMLVLEQVASDEAVAAAVDELMV